MQRLPLIIGHRGASRDAPENTLASFAAAFGQGADGVEADFRLSADGEIVCLHDEGTRRTAGVELLAARATLAELRRLDVGRLKGERWEGCRIPTLREVVGALPEEKLLFVELKGGTAMVEPVALFVEGAGLPPARLRFLSFEAGVVLALKERLPAFRACWLTDYRRHGEGWRPSPEAVLETLSACRADGLASRDRLVLDQALVSALKGRGLELHVWTVDSLAAAARLVALGVDSIMTNRPGWLKAALERPEAPIPPRGEP